MTSPLFTHRAEIVSAIQDSTGLAPYDGLAAFVDKGLRAAEARSLAATERNVERSQAIRSGIVEAIAALPLNQWGSATITQQRIVRRGPDFYHLPNVPDIGTIRSVIEERKALVPVLAPALSPGFGGYASTSTT